MLATRKRALPGSRSRALAGLVSFHVVLTAISAAPVSGQPALQRDAEIARTVRARLRLGTPSAPAAIQAGATPMSCGTARLIMTPVGGATGALAGFLLYELISLIGGEPEATTSDPNVRSGSSDLLRVVVVGGGLGLLWGFIAPPIARHCWIRLPSLGGDDPPPPRGEPVIRPPPGHPAPAAWRLPGTFERGFEDGFPYRLFDGARIIRGPESNSWVYEYVRRDGAS